VTLVNGAMGNQAADSWDSPDEANYDRINEALLQPRGLSEQQVQVIWLKVANRGSLSRPALPAADADAFVLLSALGNTVRALKMRYPNLQQIFLSSRIYGATRPSTRTAPSPTPMRRALR
jgi:hypothetical protein